MVDDISIPGDIWITAHNNLLRDSRPLSDLVTNSDQTVTLRKLLMTAAGGPGKMPPYPEALKLIFRFWSDNSDFQKIACAAARVPLIGRPPSGQNQFTFQSVCLWCSMIAYNEIQKISRREPGDVGGEQK